MTWGRPYKPLPESRTSLQPPSRPTLPSGPGGAGPEPQEVPGEPQALRGPQLVDTTSQNAISSLTVCETGGRSRPSRTADRISGPTGGQET